MSISGWLRMQKDKRREKAILHHKKHIKSRFGQGEDRHRAIQFFEELGGKQGHLGLLERFMVSVDQSIRDEEEKEIVFNILVGFGAEVMPAIENYLYRKDAANVPITWPLKVLDAVTEPREAVGIIVRALDRIGTNYTREPERKVLLVSQLAEYDDPRVVPALIPFLRDHRDEVQLEALSALAKNEDEVARESVLELLVDEQTPLRLRASIADTLQKLRWSVRGYRKKVEEALPDGMHVDRSGRIKGRWIHASSEENDE
ncbi:MAG: HEAT repeat domain-containing protein [Deltaproteobacteria bacterium]|nr:HEAT repeat domain-containing protein [Deltaproteobacteria bacterium]